MRHNFKLFGLGLILLFPFCSNKSALQGGNFTASEVSLSVYEKELKRQVEAGLLRIEAAVPEKQKKAPRKRGFVRPMEPLEPITTTTTSTQ
jgi:hypothetical protein